MSGNCLIFRGDCLDVQDKLPDGCADLVLCDPPYGVSGRKWDSVIPFGDMWRMIKRVRKAGAPVVLFGTEPFASMLRTSNLDEFRYDWYWCKNTCGQFLNASWRPMSKIETASVFCERRPPFFPQYEILKKKEKLKVKERKISVTNYCGEGIADKKSVYSLKDNNRNASAGVSHPKELIYFDGVAKRPKSRDDGEERVHPTQKPVALLSYLIRSLCPEFGLVFDFCMGSGSCGVSAILTGRKFIGIEKDGKFFEAAKKRLDYAQREAAQRLFLI